MTHRRTTAVLLPLIFLAAAAAPQNNAFLAENGYAPDAYRVLFQWEERARRGAPGYVTGYRIEARDGSGAFDLYEHQGELAAPDTLGIPPKNWNAPPRAADAVPGRASSPSTKAQTAPLPATAPPMATLTLPPPGLDALLHEDENAAKGPLRIGAVQTLPEPITVRGASATHGAWTRLPDGAAVWSVQIEAPGALGQRFELTQLELPPGARLIVYNAASPSEIYGPFTQIHPQDPALWTPTCFGEAAVLECYVPAGIPLDAGTVLVGSLALGIAVDDGVHVVSVFHEHEQAGESPKNALDQTFRRVLPAVVFTSVAVAGGFSALAFSQFTFIRHLGALTAAVMGLCLLANATLLPTLLLARR